jgi:hypothetical protein
VIAATDARIGAVGGIHELQQVVAADRHEVDPLHQRVEFKQ